MPSTKTSDPSANTTSRDVEVDYLLTDDTTIAAKSTDKEVLPGHLFAPIQAGCTGAAGAGTKGREGCDRIIA